MNYLEMDAASLIHGFNTDKYMEELFNVVKEIKDYVEYSLKESFFNKKVLKEMFDNVYLAKDYKIIYFKEDFYEFLIFNHIKDESIKTSFFFVEDKDSFIFPVIQNEISVAPNVNSLLVDILNEKRHEFLKNCLLSYL